MEYYLEKEKEVLTLLKVSSSGLNKSEVIVRQTKYGKNEITNEKKFSKLKLFLEQFNNSLIYILMGVVVISAILGNLIDSIAIAIIIILNGLLGYWQEFKSEKAIELLRQMSAPTSKVIRDNKQIVIPSTELVPGDIIVLEAGDLVPADARVIESNSLQTNEAPLTGESTPIYKISKPLDKKVPIADQKNMIFSGTIVTDGNGKAVVTSIGKLTEFGKIAESIKSIEEEQTHLQKRLEAFSKVLGFGIVILTLILFLVGVLTKIPWIESLLEAATLAVSAIPEGLPAVVTISLALGIQRMAKRKALVRRLGAVESLGAITTICSDKTGTLTKGEMTVKKIYTQNRIIDVSGTGYTPEGKFSYNNKEFNPKLIAKLLETVMLCNDAKLEGTSYSGDPTEIALLTVAQKGKASSVLRREKELPFNSERKYMATLDVTNTGKKFLHIKGAPEVVLKMCKFIDVDGRVKPMNQREIDKVLKMNDAFANSALRVLGVAYSPYGSKERLVFLGLVGMVDPPRDEVKDSIELCKQAGIDVKMITGDHALTAKAIGKQLGLGETVITGEELDNIKDEKELRAKVKATSIFARVNPEHKLKILTALQELGEVVAMTGDGINDAPAIKKANVGIAMGITGTAVSKEASDMILLDDNFVTITNAIEHGRAIYDNMKKFINYLLGANLSEVLVIAIPIFFILPLPLLPLHLLWINLVTDGLPALALSVEKPEKNIMKRKPRDPEEPILKNSYSFIFTAGILGTIAVLGIFILGDHGGDIVKARTLAMTTIVVFELLLVLVIRSEESIFVNPPFRNMYLIGAVLLSFVLHLLIIYTPISTIFDVTALNLEEWGEVFIFAIVPLIPLEIKKLFKHL